MKEIGWIYSLGNGSDRCVNELERIKRQISFNISNLGEIGAAKKKE